MNIEMKDIRRKALEIKEANTQVLSVDVKWMPRVDSVQVLFVMNSSVTATELSVLQQKLSQPIFEMTKNQTQTRPMQRLIGLNTDVPGVHLNIHFHQ